MADYFQLVKSLPLTSVRTKPQLGVTGEEGDPSKSKAVMLEQTVSEQHKVITLLHQMNSSLEEENKLFCDRIKKQDEELCSVKSNLPSQQSSGLVSGGGAVEVELAAKSKEIASLKQYIEQLETSPPSLEGPDIEIIKQQLSKERLQNSLLREQLTKRREELAGVNEDLLNKQSKLIGSETRVNALRSDLSSLQNQASQYKESIVSLTASLVERDSQLSELSKAWMEEKRSSSALRETQNKLLDEVETLRSQLESSSTSNIPTNFPIPEDSQKIGINSAAFVGRLTSLRVPLYDQVAQRAVLALELERSKGQKLGIKYRLVEAPISLKGSSLIVTSVREGSISQGVLLPGDELLEVNGYMCRGPLQDEAMKCLKQGSGRLKMVVARELTGGVYTTTGHGLVPTRLAPDGEPHAQSTTPKSPLPSNEDSTRVMSPGGSPLAPSLFNDSFDEVQSPKDVLYVPEASSPSGDSVSSLILREIQESPLDRVLEEEEEEEEEEEYDYSAYHQSLLQSMDNEEEDQYLQALRLRADLLDRDTKIKELETTIHTQDGTIKKLTVNSNQLHHELDKRGSEIRHLNELVAILEQKSSGLRQEHTASEEDKESLRNRLLAVEEELVLSQAKVSDLEEQLVGRDEEFFELTEESVQLADRCDTYKEKIKELQSTNQQLLEEVSSLTTSLAGQETGREKERKAAKNSLASVQKELNDLRSHLELKTREVESLQVSLQTERDDLHEKLSKEAACVEALNSELVSMRNVSVTNLSTSQQVKSDLEETEEKVSALEDQLASSAKHEVELRADVDALRKANSGLEQIVQQMEDEVNQVQSELSLTKEKNQKMETTVTELEALVLVLRSSGEEERRKLEKVANERDEKKKQIVQLERNVVDFKTQEERLNRRVVVEEERNMFLQAQVEQLEGRLTEKDTLRETANKESDVMKDKLASLESALVQLQGDLAGSTERESLSQQQLIKLRKDHRNLKASSSLHTESLEAENRALSTQLEELRAGMEELRGLSGEDSEKAASEIARLEAALRDLRVKMLLSDKEIITLSQGNEALEVELRKAKEMAASSAEERDALQHTISLLKDSLYQSEEKCKEHENTVRVLEEDLAGMRSDNSSLKEEIESLRTVQSGQSKEVADLKARLLSHEDELMGAQLQLGQVSRHLEDTQQQLTAEKKQGEESHGELNTVSLQYNQLKTVSERLRSELELSEASVKRLEDVSRSAEFLVTQEATKSLQLEKQMKARTEELTTIQSSWEAYQKETSTKMKALSSENSALKENIDMLKSQLQSTEEDLEGREGRLTTQLKELQSKYASTVEESRSHKEAAIMNQSLVDNLTIDLNTAREESAALNAKLQSLVQGKEVVHGELDQARVEVRELQDKMAANELDRTNLCRELEEARDSLKVKRNKMIELASEKTALQSTCDMNRQILESVEEEKTKLKQELADSLKASSSLEQVVKDSETQVRSLRADLVAKGDVIEQLQASLAKAEDVIEEKDEKYKVLEKKLFSSESEKSELVGKLRLLEQTKKETQSTIDQLVSAQSALKEALTASGDQRETEVVKLREQVTELEKTVVSLNLDKEVLSEKEKQMLKLMEDLEKERLEMVSSLHKQKEQQLKLRYEHVKETSSLQEGFDLKEREVKDITHRNKELEETLKEKTTELNTVQEELASLVSLKLIVAEKQSLEDTLRKEVKSLKSQNTLLDQEHQRVLGLLRKHEVEASTRNVPPPPTPKQAKSASKDQLRAMLKERDEEVVRLREYVQKLLEKVVEKAPHLLEAMHQ